jgi:hypothetical protein
VIAARTDRRSVWRSAEAIQLINESQADREGLIAWLLQTRVLTASRAAIDRLTKVTLTAADFRVASSSVPSESGGVGANTGSGSGDGGNAAGGGSGGPECAVCCMEYEVGDELLVLPCGDGKHRFHAACAEKWLMKCSATCPLCRHPVLC